MSQAELVNSVNVMSNKLTALTAAIENLEVLPETVASLDKLLVAHMAAEEITTKNIISALNEARADIEALTTHQDRVAHEMQEHIETRVSQCNRDILSRLDNDFMDRNEIKILRSEIAEQQTLDMRNEITKAILASESRTDSRTESRLSVLKASIDAKEDKYLTGLKVAWWVVAAALAGMVSVTAFMVKYGDIIHEAVEHVKSG